MARMERILSPTRLMDQVHYRYLSTQEKEVRTDGGGQLLRRQKEQHEGNRNRI